MNALQRTRVQLMHNGIEVTYGGYHEDWMAHVIRGLNGHHEPQEDIALQASVSTPPRAARALP